jgi:hypothetical protein
MKRLAPSGLFTLALLVLLGVNAAVFGLRLHFVIESGELWTTTGVEGPAIYSLWKALSGHPVYEMPQRFPFALTLYNFLFYCTYGVVFKVFGVTGPELLTTGRLLTLAFALFGAFCNYRLLVWFDERSRLGFGKPMAAALAGCVWFSAHFVNWWPITLRPDIAAVSIALAALYLALLERERNRPALLIAASLLFFLAWGFKQSCIALFAGLLMYYAVIARDVRRTICLIAPFSILAIVALWVGGAEYRYNILYAPSISPLTVQYGLWQLFLAVAPNLFFWGLAVVGLLAKAEWQKTPLDAVFAVSFAVGMILLCKEGSYRNNILEAFCLSAILALAGLAAVLRHASAARAKAGRVAIAALLASMFVVPVATLAAPHRFHALGAPPEQTAARRALADFVRTLPRPVFVADEVLAQPWISNASHYPAFLIDPVFWVPAEQRGIIEEGGIRGLIGKRYFGALLVAKNSALHEAALAAGYAENDPPVNLESFPDAYVSNWHFLRVHLVVLRSPQAKGAPAS